jgi:capsular exopolysaccharide synthesis family protein
VSAHEPGSVVAEAYRSIRARLLISQAGEAPRVILFTSAIQGEGKTTTMLNTAAMFAQLGSPVAVVDADLRRPRCHKILGIRNEMGLTEVLTGQTATVPEIRVFDSPLFFLPSGVTPPNPSELFGSTKMKETIASLRERYAYVLIDSPPLSSVSDALVLTGLVDGVVLVVDQQRTPREMIRESCEKLSHVDGKVFGVVLNRASPQANPYGEHAYTSYEFEAGV